MGIVRAFTDAEYEQLASTCGDLYLEMLSMGGKCYGFNMPWAGNSLFYYNKTMFEEYGVKSPAEYYKEGNWTWETMYKCLEEITKDLDGDGNFDTYGSGAANTQRLILCNEYDFLADGSLTHKVDTQMYRDYLDMMWEGETSGVLGTYSDCNIATSPRPGTHIGDAEWYNFEHLNQTIANGDVIETIMIPTYTGSYDTEYVQFTPNFMSIFTTCDENEAALSLLTYILRVGMRYMSEYSCGLFGCSYEGIRGVTEYSLGWRQNFQDVCEERLENFEALEDWDQELWDMMYEDILTCKPKIPMWYPDLGTSSGDTSELPPASKLPIILADTEAFVDAYNSMYVNK